jgi:single-strand DNA-binding protein
MAGINKVIILGRLGKDPELKYTPSGTAVCTFSVATSKTWKDKDGKQQEKTQWHNMVIWQKLAEVAAKYLTKGSQAYFEGEIETRSYEGKDGDKRYITEIIVNKVEFVGSKGNGGGGNGAPGPSEPDANQMSNDASFAADDIPF